MKQILLTTLVVLGSAALLQAERYYVSENGDGQGSSWKDALESLQAALNVAKDGDEIWVANGTYVPTQDNDRNQSFVIPCGVKMLGGFIGNEKKLKDRDLTKGETILSGEIGDIENVEDNSYTIVYFDLTGSTTVLNGFTITKAYANGFVEGVNKSTCGGAVFVNGDRGLSSPEISHCIFIDNFSREGGAIYNYAKDKGIANPTISDCKFLYNRSNFKGGAIFNDGNHNGICSPTIKNCRFDSNESIYGGAIMNRGIYGECMPIVYDCVFVNNYSTADPNAIFNQREGSSGICEVTESGCVYEGNRDVFNDTPDGPYAIEKPSDNSGSKSGFQKRKPVKAAIAY